MVLCNVISVLSLLVTALSVCVTLAIVWQIYNAYQAKKAARKTASDTVLGAFNGWMKNDFEKRLESHKNVFYAAISDIYLNMSCLHLIERGDEGLCWGIILAASSRSFIKDDTTEDWMRVNLQAVMPLIEKYAPFTNERVLKSTFKCIDTIRLNGFNLPELVQIERILKTI